MRRGAVLAVLLLAGAATVPAHAQGQEGNPRAGRRLAAGVCSSCHGQDGIATLPEAPNLAGQNAAYVAAQLRAYRARERENEQMNIVARELTDGQIADLAAWYAAIEVTATVPGR
ncbi:c-type cytochrome [Roseomonas populi]|uniref:C-type cytochrome n=1 Tax=Roseomonas populi TaxID=3121582 RepID=A0ABT1X5N4_9PROT|nr:c-type cytochrome [Roseomonas pecuniae]MCR0983415.1 c-type cytochrome [Roseomonas pecuniae]